MAEPAIIEEETVSAAADYIFEGTNYGQFVAFLEDDQIQGRLYSNGEVIACGIADTNIKDLIIPDEIDGYPVTAICDRAFASESGFDYYIYYLNSVTIGDNVRYIGEYAFGYQEYMTRIVLGENVEELASRAFYTCNFIDEFVWNEKIKVLGECSLAYVTSETRGAFPFPKSIEHFEYLFIAGIWETWVVRENVKYVERDATYCNNFVALNMDMEINTFNYNTFPSSDVIIYCLENSTLHEKLKSGEITNEYHLIENAYLTSEKADIGEDFTISGLPQGLTKESVKEYLNVEGEAEIRVADDTIKTGTKIELVNVSPEFVYKTYTASVNGDLNGDGSVNTADDTAALRKIIAGNDAEFSEAHINAADLNGDGLVNSTDLTLMKFAQN